MGVGEFVFTATGLTRGIGSGYYVYNEKLTAYLFILIYYSLIGFLLYKTFNSKQVKIKYPIILLIILIITTFGLGLLLAYQGW